jgi:hypothetical protein
MWRVKAVGLVSQTPYEYEVDLPLSASAYEAYSSACVAHGRRLVAGEVNEHLDTAFGSYSVSPLVPEVQ